jgi:hypothetical protein
VEALPGHTLAKVREKVRVFQLTLQPGESRTLDYAFFHLTVVSEAGSVERGASSSSSDGVGGGGSWTEEKRVGDAEWSGPVFGRTVKNVGAAQFSCYVVQWRNFVQE